MIHTVAIVGFGAMGCAFAGKFQENGLGPESLRVIADSDRIRRYQKDGVYSNGVKLNVRYCTPGEQCGPADLLIVSTKFDQLKEAAEQCRTQVGEHTKILSLLNGVTSEEVLARIFGEEKVLYCTVAAVAAGKTGNRAECRMIGTTYFGEKQNVPGAYSQKVKEVKAFLDAYGIPNEVPEDMVKKIWWKFMLNVGINESTAAFRADYGTAQNVPEIREMTLASMREVLAISDRAGIGLSQSDIDGMMDLLDHMDPVGRTSMCQDVLAGRHTEIDMLAGTVIHYGKKYGVPTPVNEFLYDLIKGGEHAQEYQKKRT